MSTLTKLDKIDRTKSLRYGISLPSGYSANPIKSWPVLCFLHGTGECGQAEDSDNDIEEALTRHGPLKDSGSSQKEKDGFILVLPQLPCPPGKDKVDDVWRQYAKNVKEIVTSVQKDYGGDKEKTYLTGFSYGGNGVFDIAMEQKDFWAALWPVDPTLLPENKPECPVWLIWRFQNDLGFDEVEIDELQEENPIPKGKFLYTHSKKDHVHTASFAYSRPEFYKWLTGSME